MFQIVRGSPSDASLSLFDESFVYTHSDLNLPNISTVVNSVTVYSGGTRNVCVLNRSVNISIFWRKFFTPVFGTVSTAEISAGRFLILKR
jgi:hypothetical protein